MNLRIAFVLALAGSFFVAAPARAQSAKFELKPGDHIALIGNELPDRFQHSGWLETFIYAKYPDHKLVFRNLAFPADEITFRQREEGFGTQDEWLKKVQADVIFAFFGFNESFKGHAGVDAFKRDLDKYLKDLMAKDYSGHGNARVVLFSPIANEKMQDPNFPDPTAINANLREYSEAMAEVAKADGVPFVDLFQPSLQAYASAAQQKKSLTMDTMHLTEEGDRAVGEAIFKGLFGGSVPAVAEMPAGGLEKLRVAINEKSEEWHSRYRTIDGYNVYGGRSYEAYATNGARAHDQNPKAPLVSNFQVMQQEMSVRDTMTANRDKKVWAVSKGGDLVVDDANIPAVTKVGTDFRGANPDGTFPFLGGKEAISKMKVHSGMKVNLFASEEMFPELSKPVQMAWDTKGRLWVSVWPNYPERTPDSKKGDSLIILEDTDGDGVADKVTHFIDDLNAPTGFQFYKDGVMLVQAPNLWYVRDTDGDGKADWKERVVMGLDSADSHHTANALVLDPGGAIYLSDGVFMRTAMETYHGPLRNNDGAIYRFEPRTGQLETYVSYGFANPHGRVFDYWGNDIITDATGNANYFGPAFSGRIDYPAKHSGMKEFWNRPSRPCGGTGILTSKAFPPELQGQFMNCNVISFQGVYMVKVTEDGSGLKGETVEDLVSSSDPNFRPIYVNVGPDGAIYICDWHNPIIGHLQHHLRDPNRDHDHGRIYRVTYDGIPPVKPIKIDGQPIPALLELLKEPEDQTRTLAKVELGKHEPAQVIAAVNKWVAGLDKKDPRYEHDLTEALWVHQWMNVVDTGLLKSRLKSPEPRARAAAAHVLCYWRDHVPDALALFKAVALDENPRVRLEAVRAASFFTSPEAVDVALAILKHPTDYYLDYTLKETLRQLEPIWRKAISSGTPIAADNPAGIDHLVHSVTTAELMKLPRTPTVQQAILMRPEVADVDRQVALMAIAKEHKVTPAAQLASVLESGASDVPSLSRLLTAQRPEDLKAIRSQLVKLTTKSGSAGLHEAAWGALALADGSFETVWKEASKSSLTLTELLEGIPMLPDPDFRAQAYDQVKPLLSQWPANLSADLNAHPGAQGRYVRIELPRRGTLTLAEVQVFSAGKNIARQGKARQSSVASGGTPERAIDGNTDGAYDSGSSTHTREGENKPWWEVDLGNTQSIDSIAVWNRTDGELGNRLEGFTLTVLDGNRREVFSKAGIAAPAKDVKLALGGDPGGTLRQAAIRALVSMNHEQPAVFTALAGLIGKGEQVAVAAQGLRSLPRTTWPKAEAGVTATKLVAWAKAVPAGDRTAQDYIETVQFASDLAGLLPADQAASLRGNLKSLRVAVYVIRTVREQMRYDTPRLVVEAGKPVEIIVENADFMPHNLSVVKPGTREKVALAAANMRPDDMDNRGRAYVPRMNEVVNATKLIEAGQRETLKFTAPEQTGDYEYVCTFPNHYQTMWGLLIVTKDVDAYLAAHP